MNYTVIYHDQHGETHFADRELDMAERAIAPPADPALASAELPVSAMSLVRLPPSWFGDMASLAGSGLDAGVWRVPPSWR